jgi:hypothetical protein
MQNALSAALMQGWQAAWNSFRAKPERVVGSGAGRRRVRWPPGVSASNVSPGRAAGRVCDWEAPVHRGGARPGAVRSVWRQE